VCFNFNDKFARNIYNFKKNSGTYSHTCKGKGKGKGKAIPLPAWTGSKCSRKLRLPDFKTIGTQRW